MGTISTLSAVFLPEILRIGKDIASSNVGGIAAVATGLCAMLCAVTYLGVMRRYINGESVSGWDICQPMVILIVVANFSTFVLSPLSAATLSVTGAVARQIPESEQLTYTKAVGVAATTYGGSLNKTADRNAERSFKILKWLGFDKDVDGNTVEGVTSYDDINEKFGFGKRMLAYFLGAATSGLDFLGTIGDTAGTTVSVLLAGILMFVYNCLLIAMQYTCAVELTILSIVGPLVFCIAVLPQYRGGMVTWIARYVQLSMWAPIIFIVNLVGTSIIERLPAILSEYALGGTMACVVIICNILVMSQVPHMAGWVMEASGVGGTFAKIQGSAGKAAASAGKVATKAIGI